MVLHSALGFSVWSCGPGSDCISGGDDLRITKTLLDLHLRAPHTCMGPGQDRSLQDIFSCLVLKLPSKGTALGVSCRSSPCCKIFSGVCSVVAVSPLPLSFQVKELLPQSLGLVSETQFPKLRFWGLVQAVSAESENRQQRLSVLSGVYLHRLSAGLVASTECHSASCQVTLRHPFPGPSVPFPRVLLSAALCAPVPGAGIAPRPRRGLFLASSTRSLPLVLQPFFLPAQGTEKCWHCQKPCVHYDSPNIPLFLLFC